MKTNIIICLIVGLCVVGFANAQEIPKEYWQIEVIRSKAALAQLERATNEWRNRLEIAETRIKAMEALEENEAEIEKEVEPNESTGE